VSAQGRNLGRRVRLSIRHYAAEQGLSLGAVAERAGMSRATLQRRLARPEEFGTNELDRLAGAFGVPVLEFLGFSEERS